MLKEVARNTSIIIHFISFVNPREMANAGGARTIPVGVFCGQDPRTDAVAIAIADSENRLRKEFDEKLHTNRAKIAALERSRSDNRAKIAALEKGRAENRARFAALENWRDAVEADRSGSRRLDIYDFL